MYRSTKVIVSVGFVVASVTTAQPLFRQAAPGDIATGEVVRQDVAQLQLNVTPCSNTKRLIVFRDPYVQQPAGKVTCNGAQKNLVQAVQRR